VRRLRIGIVGAGFGSYGLLPAFRRDHRCEVTAIATSSEDTAARAASRLGVHLAFGCWQQLVESDEVDAIAIATPPVLQPRIALAAIALGKPVFAEKPIAATLTDAETLWKAAEAARVANVVDLLFPELHVFGMAKNLIRQGGIGTPLHIAAEWIFWSFDHRENVTTWRTDASSGGGALAHFGSHMIYYLQWFFGPIVSVTARVSKPVGYRHSGDTLGTMMLSFENGASGTLTVSSGTPTTPRHSVQILGTTGSLMLSNTSGSPVSFTLQHRDGVMSEPEQSGVDCRAPATARIVRRFVDWILTGETTRPSFHDGLEVQRIIELAKA
jgi:predicted dehydrogenase